MDDKIVKIKKHIDQLADAKENSPKKEKGGVSVSCDISGESNTIQNASKIEVNNHYHNKQAHIEKMLKMYTQNVPKMPHACSNIFHSCPEMFHNAQSVLQTCLTHVPQTP